MNGEPSLDDIEAAARRIAPHAHHTPVLRCRSIDERVDASLFFKCENFQKAGAFKFRGACNTVFSLSAGEVERGVVTHSSGNHAAALSLAARLRGTHAVVVMPTDANPVKRAAVLGYGGEVVGCEPTQAAREATVARLVAERGLVPVPPFDDYRVVAGQGTAGLELVREVPGLDCVVAPVGGGGLLSGTAIAVSEASPGTEVVGAEPAGASDTFRSFEAGTVIPLARAETMADGLRTSVGALTFPIIKARVLAIVTVREDSIVAAMRLMLERMKIVVEPSAAVPLAALLEGSLKGQGRRLGVIVSGGNLDLDALPWAR